MSLGMIRSTTSSQPEMGAATDDRQAWRALHADGATFVSRGPLGGLICGVVIGGVGGDWECSFSA